MAFLLDTHTLLWAILDDDRLSGAAKKYITDTSNICYFSIVSLWEITIKYSLGALDLKMPLKDCFNIITDTGFTELEISKDHLIELDSLPSYRKDPFDRILIGQAISQSLSIITKDSVIERYNVQTVW
jgi:PIN domain nuclease of toxin-antitoxin system